MLKVYKRDEGNFYKIQILDTETENYQSYMTDKKYNIPIHENYRTDIRAIGYKNIDDFLKTLEKRKFLGDEINFAEQKELERIGFIKLGADRVKKAERINTKDFEDIIEKLSNYNMGFVDAQNSIIAEYLHNIEKYRLCNSL
ncbi:MAG TPA: hypothetical protein VK982_08650 [Bacteroidales bacterium]|nr:hypothetical protein [Bacteroidales bacterium]